MSRAIPIGRTRVPEPPPCRPGTPASCPHCAGSCWSGTRRRAAPTGSCSPRSSPTATRTRSAALVRRHGPMVLGVCRRVIGDHHARRTRSRPTFLVLARRAAVVRAAGAGRQLAVRGGVPDGAEGPGGSGPPPVPREAGGRHARAARTRTPPDVDRPPAGHRRGTRAAARQAPRAGRAVRPRRAARSAKWPSTWACRPPRSPRGWPPPAAHWRSGSRSAASRSRAGRVAGLLDDSRSAAAVPHALAHGLVRAAEAVATGGGGQFTRVRQCGPTFRRGNADDAARPN